MYNILTGLEEEKGRLISHLGMLIKVTSEPGMITSGEVSTNGMYYQLTVQLSNHANDFRLMEKLVKQLAFIGKGMFCSRKYSFNVKLGCRINHWTFKCC